MLTGGAALLFVLIFRDSENNITEGTSPLLLRTKELLFDFYWGVISCPLRKQRFVMTNMKTVSTPFFSMVKICMTGHRLNNFLEIDAVRLWRLGCFGMGMLSETHFKCATPIINL